MNRQEEKKWSMELELSGLRGKSIKALSHMHRIQSNHIFALCSIVFGAGSVACASIRRLRKKERGSSLPEVV
jgi:hypothetical protein